MTDKAWFQMTAEETLRELDTGPAGLTATEAAARLQRFGPNTLREAKGISAWQLFFAQFKNFLILLLIAATALSLALGHTLDAIVIFSIVIVTALLGFYQEFRAERAMQALKAMASPTASVVRDGAPIEVASADVVPGDIVVLRAGDRVPADARLLEAPNLKADEASLTGESTAVEKDARARLGPDAGVGDRRNMVFAGTAVTYGRGQAVVTATGMQTEFGRIAKMLQDVEEEPSPLAVKMDYIGKRLGTACLGISAAVVALGIFRGNPPLDMLIWGISLAIAAVPEALAAVVTGALAIGVQRAARRRAIIRRLPAVETLGCTTVICSDKTGTLTRNEMTVRKVFASGQLLDVTGVGYDPTGEFRANGTVVKLAEDPAAERLLLAAALCNDTYFISDNGVRRVNGDPTEAALLVLAEKGGMAASDLRQSWPRVAEIPFESERKRMSTVHTGKDGGVVAFVKGAPDLLVDRCVAWERAGRVEPLTPEARTQILQTNDKMASEALRVLGIAFRRLDGPPSGLSPDTLETELTFLGLVGMIDPPRD